MRRFGLRPGLETTLRLAAAAGDPHRALRFIHVAGTNGKGSTCAFLESIFRRAGYRVGLYTSPHLVSFRERIQVQRVPIPESDVARLVQEMRRGLPNAASESHPTFFEFVTVLALRWFQEQACDLVVWETGLGGRLDATNIVQPEASVITNIGWDHMQWLGPTLRHIAKEKAGIIKPGIPVLTSTDEPEALEVLVETAREAGAPMQVVTETAVAELGIHRCALPLEGQHQRRNAALAAATARTLAAKDWLGVKWPEGIQRGLEAATWEGRFQIVERGDQVVVLDGAHNRPAFETLAATVRTWRGGKKPAMILGMLADKDLDSAAEILATVVRRVVVVPVQSVRGSDPAEVAGRWTVKAPSVGVEVASGLEDALARLKAEPVVLVAGSLYLVGECLSWLRGEITSERELNEWSQRR
ncbi:MAG: bifunctional folylpolyglutamate synthase/dihydrofolate synthase [Verrucomicrobiales bacterium]|nr:bifunctional folylpolyglutamate synthase/dihydrofolate synthase [Verrucomicrobiales bacterium]